MIESFKKLFSADGFMPHGHCYLWEPGVLWLHILSDALIALAYFSIPFTLFYFVRKRRTIEFKGILICFAIFIVACGLTHVMEIVVIWQPFYWLEGGIKAVTAVASVLTAVLLFRMLPMALKLPSPAALQKVNQALENEVAVRRRAEDEIRKINNDLETRVRERTQQLEAAIIANQLEITERRHAEQILNQQADELRRSNDDLQQFAYSASHDLQEPLRAISGCLQLLERRYRPQLDARGAELIGHSVDGAKRMGILIEGLLAFSRISFKAPNFVPVDCNGPVAYAMENLHTAIEESGAVMTHEILPIILGDETQLTALFQNLIANAIKFRGAATPKIHIGATRDNGEWILFVRDNGIGMAPEHFERIFVLFQRLNPRDKYPGNGIGLALCKKIVERHGGHIIVSSESGQGSTFACRFPFFDESSQNSDVKK